MGAGALCGRVLDDRCCQLEHAAVGDGALLSRPMPSRGHFLAEVSRNLPWRRLGPSKLVGRREKVYSDFRYPPLHFATHCPAGY